MTFCKLETWVLYKMLALTSPGTCTGDTIVDSENILAGVLVRGETREDRGHGRKFGEVNQVVHVAN